MSTTRGRTEGPTLLWLPASAGRSAVSRCLGVWSSLLMLATATGLGVNAAQDAAVTNISYSDARPVLDALREDLWPEALRGRTPAQVEAAWPQWVQPSGRSGSSSVTRRFAHGLRAATTTRSSTCSSLAPRSRRRRGRPRANCPASPLVPPTRSCRCGRGSPISSPRSPRRARMSASSLRGRSSRAPVSIRRPRPAACGCGSTSRNGRRRSGRPAPNSCRACSTNPARCPRSSGSAASRRTRP